MHGSWDMVRDGLTDRRTENVTLEVGATPSPLSWLESTFWNTCYLSMHIVLIGKKNRKKKEEKIFSLQLLGTSATLRNVLKS